MSSAYFRSFLVIFMKKPVVIFFGFVLFAFFVAPARAGEDCKLEEFRWQEKIRGIIHFSGLLEGSNCPKIFVAVLRDKKTGEYLGNTTVYTTAGAFNGTLDCMCSVPESVTLDIRKE